MKKTYSALEAEVILLNDCDILTLSNGNNAGEGAGIVIENLNSLISGN